MEGDIDWIIEKGDKALAYITYWCGWLMFPIIKLLWNNWWIVILVIAFFNKFTLVVLGPWVLLEIYYKFKNKNHDI